MSSFIPTLEAEATSEQAKRLDDPFRAAKFGTTGQYRVCDMCCGTFESRGLKLCPDCYEIRKQQPGFDDDKRFTSAAGKVAFEHRLCLWCQSPIERFRDGRKVRADVAFCSKQHGQAHHRASPEEREARMQRLRELR